MKIICIQAGIPHYLKLLFNRLNALQNIEIVALIPKENSTAVGSGVHQDSHDADFRIVQLPEKKMWWSKLFFEGLDHLLEEEKPNAIIIGWPYILGYVFSFSLKKTIKKHRIKVIYKDIPFNIPPYNQAHHYFVSGQIRNEKGSTATGLISYLKYRLLTYCRKIYLQKVDACIFYTDASISLMQTYNVSSSKIFVTANSPDTDILLSAFENVKQLPLKLAKNSHRIIHIGRLVKWKRVDDIILAVKNLRVQFPNIELLIVGYGPEETALKTLVTQLNLNDHIVFVGGVYQPVELGQYLHESSIYILAGMGGLSINDAMCFAKPIICSIADGTEAKLVKEGENGYYFEEGNVPDLAAKIASLLAQPNDIKTFGQKSIEIIQNEVNIHTVVSQYVNMLNFVNLNHQS